MSLDGFIAPTNGSSDWIVTDESIDFKALYSRFDLFVMGRKTYEAIVVSGLDQLMQGRAMSSVYVLSRTMRPEENPGITIIAENYLDFVRDKVYGEKRSVWIMGGGWLAAECLNAGLLSAIEIAVMPTVLGNGFKLLDGLSESVSLHLESVENLESSGIVQMNYSVINSTPQQGLKGQ
ncbi:hypothetical protein LIA77_00506 [Sarocladium implicatum]|nr:hypothetical protein LIA77_00506 [Sarocladium implicatum]